MCARARAGRPIVVVAPPRAPAAALIACQPPHPHPLPHPNSGNNIAGPLPRSWMQDQLALQLQILQRQRQLGIVGQLPGFQGNVPWALATLKSDSNMTQQGDTGWMNSVDPFFGQIADAWMAKLCSVMGCQDKWFQLDGYFDGATAPWMTQGIGLHPATTPRALPASAFPSPLPGLSADGLDLPACAWSALVPGTYLAGCDAANCASYATLDAAQAACVADTTCGGLTSAPNGQPPWEVRAGNAPLASPSGEASYYITNYADCRPPPPPITPDPVWMERGAYAYMGLNRTVPGAVWSFQGWAIIDWSTQPQGSAFRGFVDTVPEGNFVVIDMSVDGTGEWDKWNNASFFGAPFVWTSLHDFGGTDAMKGDIARANQIPYAGLSPLGTSTVVGVGATPEGIDQNPIYYELIAASNFRDAPIGNLTDHAIRRAAKRYGLPGPTPEVATAWALLVNSTYAQDLSVQDPTGIPHLPGSSSQFENDRATPTPRLCLTWQAWGQLLAATSYIDANSLETFRYDLVNLGRELLAQLSTPASMNFSDAFTANPVNGAAVNATGAFYVNLLLDADTLLQTESAFLLGPWLAMARAWGANSSDCVQGSAANPLPCPDFYEFNARTQLTTWNPTPKGANSIPGGPIDYASKHWSGLIRDYYASRASGILALAQDAASKGKGIDGAALSTFKATNAYTFQNTFGNPYPLNPVGDPVVISKAMYAKYAPFYAACGAAA